MNRLLFYENKYPDIKYRNAFVLMEYVLCKAILQTNNTSALRVLDIIFFHFLRNGGFFNGHEAVKVV